LHLHRHSPGTDPFGYEFSPLILEIFIIPGYNGSSFILRVDDTSILSVKELFS
jgi:hypothetical protein